MQEMEQEMEEQRGEPRRTDDDDDDPGGSASHDAIGGRDEQHVEEINPDDFDEREELGER